MAEQKPRIAFVGERMSEEDASAGTPFAGFTGRFLRPMLRQIGVERQACLFTNVFNSSEPIYSWFTSHKSEALADYPRLSPGRGRPSLVHKRAQIEIDRLNAEIARFNPNVIVALGSTPLWAFYKSCQIKKYRGTFVLSHCGRKVLPTYHPLAVNGQWKLRPIMFADVTKAYANSTFPELRRPRRTIFIEPNLQDIREFIDRYIAPAQFVSCDIETKKIMGKPTITEIGFAPTRDIAIVIPFWDRDKKNYWPTAKAEIAAWRLVEEICRMKPLIGQNFNYDVEYLFRRMGVKVMQVGGDTMLLHHALYPEMEKGLGFLASLCTEEPSWKFMRTDHDSYKDGDE